MTYAFEQSELGAFFSLSTDFCQDKREFDQYKDLIHLFWNQTNESIQLVIDGIDTALPPRAMISTTFLHHLDIPKFSKLTAFSFNRNFYCIQDHDEEVSCNGILFFGTSSPTVIPIDEQEYIKFDALYRVFQDEFMTRDDIQGEMLQMLLKRLIIKTTRLARKIKLPENLSNSQVDTIRHFHVLVDLHYRTHKQVADYADMLHKSPKTLSNLFAIHDNQSPLQIIHQRIVLEMKRLLLVTDKTFKEIALDLGFQDVQAGHKLFKKLTGQTPQDFKTVSKNTQKEKSTT